MVHLSHGPVGCGYYSWSTRRNLAQGTPGVGNFVPFQFASDYQEPDIVYGGAQRLETIGREIRALFPLAKGISVQSECPIGLIGDDIEASAKTMRDELGIDVVPVRCEGFRGVSQSLGHHIANDAIRDHVLGTGALPDAGPYDVAIIGTTTSAATPGRAERSSRRWGCAWCRCGPAMGVPFRQMHSWGYSGPYHGYEGFPIFARDMDMAVNSPTWKLVRDPFAA